MSDVACLLPDDGGDAVGRELDAWLALVPRERESSKALGAARAIVRKMYAASTRLRRQ